MTAAEKRVRDSLLRAQKRRDEKYRNERTVYAYRERSTGVLTDNLLLLPESEKAGHVPFFEQMISRYLVDNPGADIDRFDIVRVGVFNKVLNNYRPVKPLVALNLSELKDRFCKVHKEKTNE